ncbi:MAG: transposase, partial [Myxococcales bacterium]|nr:transposase [Myxococcales bacterium]
NPSNIGNIAQGFSEPRRPKATGQSLRSYFFTNSQRRLGQWWSDAFHKKVYPVLLRLEGEFARLYADGTGRPNYSVARIVGIALLQEMFGLADQQALDALVFDLRWQHALGFAQEEEPYLSRRSYVEFRRRLAKQDPQMTLLRRVFDQVGAAAMEDLDVSPTEQRLDSTRIVSNIASLGRTDLFASTLRVFLRELKRRWPDKWESLPHALREWYEAKESGKGWFSGGGADKQRQRLEQLARISHKSWVTTADSRASSGVVGVFCPRHGWHASGQKTPTNARVCWRLRALTRGLVRNPG